MKLARFAAIPSALALAALLAGCATQVPPGDPVYTRIGELQHQVDQLQKLVKGQQFMSVVSDQQALQQRISSLRGQLETLQHQLKQLRRRQQSVNRNFDQRLATLEGGVPQGVDVTGPIAATSGTTQKSAGGTSQNAGGATAANGKQAGTSSQSVSDHTAYRAAFDKLRAGHNEAAVRAFKAFIQDYPDSSLVPNAWYWMAETHYVNGNYKEAIGNFKKVITQYADSPKAADSYLKIGYAQYALGNYDKARSTFKDVVRKYPGSTPADLARQRLRKMGAGD